MKTLVVLLFTFLAENCVTSGIGGCDKSENMELTAPDCIRPKWEFWVSFYDINKDGAISMADLEQARKTFIRLHKLSGENKKSREDIFTKWWTDAVFWNQSEISVDEFVAFQNAAYLEDKDTFVEKIRKDETLLVACLNVDNDGYISKEEETTFLIATGITDEKNDEKFFESFDPEDKGIPVDEAITFWVKYLTECSEEEKIKLEDQKKLLSNSS